MDRADPTLTLGDLEAVLDACPQGFIAVDEHLRVVRWNDTARRILGWSLTEVVGAPDPSIPPDLADATGRYARDRFAGVTRSEDRVGERVAKDGTSRTLVETGTVLLELPAGRVLGVFFREASDDDVRQQLQSRLSRELVDAVREDEVLHVLSRAVERILGADRAAVLTVCPSGEHLHGRQAIGGLQEEVEQVRIDLDASPRGCAWAAALDGDPCAGMLPGPAGPTPALFVPMGPSGGRRVLAVLYRDTVPSDSGLVAAARTLADEAWLALERAGLVGELEGKVEILEATAAVAASAGLDLVETGQAIARHAAAALSCERAALYLRDDDGGLTLLTLHASDLATDTDAGARTALTVIERGDPVLVQDAATCDFLDGPWHAERGAVSVYGLPLEVAGRDIGVLVVAHTVAHPRGFTNLCQQVGAAVAQQAALALEHARLYAQQQATVDQLRELDQLKADYVAGLTHDLKTPLTGLSGFVQTLRRLGDSVSPEDRRTYLAVMERQSARLIEMVEDLLLAAKLDAGDGEDLGQRETLDLATLASDVVARYEPAGTDRLQVLAGRSLARGDASQLTRVVENLVDNALKYAEEGPVEITVRVDGADAVLSVRDHGPGVPTAEQDRIFDRFRAGEAGQARRSTGLGLYIARGIARANGGDLEVRTPRDGVGVAFDLRLPAVEVAEASVG